MTNTALQAADSLAASLIHKLPTVVQPAFDATIKYYQTKAFISITAPLLVALILLAVYEHYLAIFQDRLAEAKERKHAYHIEERTFNIALYKTLSAIPFIVLSIFFVCGICEALPFFMSPQVATALALLHK